MDAVGKELVHLRSTPALAIALRQMNRGRLQFEPVPLPQPSALPPMYRLRSGDVATESEAASRLVGEVAERMRRLTSAYGEWHGFDAPAYFDLPRELSSTVVRVVERVSTVHVIFFVDLLLPAFQRAATFWSSTVVPAYTARTASIVTYRHFFEEVQPAMVVEWEHLLDVLVATRTLLLEDIGFLTTSGAADERMRWQPLWQAAPIAELDPTLAPALPTIPTLTLALDFPLPAQRQPGRLRRLRRNRERRQARHVHR
ncbi:MAG: hypothetical protein R2867_30155 [Caldilineaceae bacterium]